MTSNAPRLLLATLVLGLAAGAPAAALDWTPFAAESVIEILTFDEDGALRETKVWIVVLDAHGYVRTNDSRWLANIRRGSSIRLRVGGAEVPVAAEETSDAEETARVEEAFKTKYGLMQRLMSFFRIEDPTVLRLSAAPAEDAAPEPGA